MEQDLQALRGTRIALVLAVPLALWADPCNFLSRVFDEIKHIPAALTDPSESDFLQQVLVKRRALDMMAMTEPNTICRFSGGVMRDLIILARCAAEYAFTDDLARIEPKHVHVAVRQRAPLPRWTQGCSF